MFEHSLPNIAVVFFTLAGFINAIILMWLISKRDNDEHRQRLKSSKHIISLFEKITE